MVIEWSPALAVGVPEIDAQHRELFQRAERLIAALRADDRSGVRSLVAYLSDYASRHFEDEERLMGQVGFPGLEEHRAAHLSFKKEYEELVREYERKGATPLVSLTLHNWLSDWLRKHVTTLDLQLAEFVRGRGAGGAG